MGFLMMRLKKTKSFTKARHYMYVTFCLPASSGDNLGKQFGRRSGPQIVEPDQGPNCLTS